MGAFNPTEGMKVDEAELKKALGQKGSADSDEGEEGDEDAGGDDQTVGSRYAAIADRLGAASLPNQGGPGAKYVGPAPGPMQSQPKLASALTMMGPKPSMPGAPKSDDADQGGDSDPAASGSSIPMLTADQLQAARDEKQRLGMWGALADNLSNRQSFGNFFLGHMNPHTDASSVYRQQQGLVDQGIQDTKTLQAQAMQAPQMQYMAELQKPDSDASNAKREEAKMGINALVQAKLIDPDKAQSLVASLQNMNGFQAGKMMEGNPLLKQAADVMKSQATLAMAGRRLDQGDKRIGLAQDNQAAGAAGAVDKDPIVQSTTRQINQIGIDRHTLQSASIVTPQMVHEIGAGVAMALSGGKAVGLGQMEMQDMSTLQTHLAALEQKLTNSPQDGASAPIKAQILETLDRLEEGYKKVQGARAKQLAVGRSYPNNPAAQQALQQKVDSYVPAPQPSGMGFPGTKDVLADGFSDADRAAYQAATHDLNDPSVDQATKAKALNVILNLSKKSGGK